jgi:hypothetical protein
MVSLTLYTGKKSLGADKESNWLPAPDGHFSHYIRAYWGKEPILDGSWQPLEGLGIPLLEAEVEARNSVSPAPSPNLLKCFAGDPLA